MPTINFSIDETTSANAQAAATALRSLTQEYQKLNRVLVKTEKQLLKFDEINRLVAYADKPVSAVRASSGRSSSSSKTTTKKTDTDASPKTAKAGGTGTGKDTSASLPLHLALKDIFFEWGDLNWEVIMMKLIAGLNALAGGVVGFFAGGMFAGPQGAFIGLTLGLLFSILADSAIFNFDGKLSEEEFLNGLKALLPAAGGILGLVIGGPLGGVIGATLGTVLSFSLLGINWEDITGSLNDFFIDFYDYADLRFQSIDRLFHESIDGLKRWWSNLSFSGFHLSLPHLTVTWEMLSPNSILARYLNIGAIPHLGVQWYARGGIVDGATLIGAGESGKEAIIPLERNTDWIRRVAEELMEELRREAAALAPGRGVSGGMIPLPAAAGSLIPPGALNNDSRPVTDGLADAIVSALSVLGNQWNGAGNAEPVIRVYLDGKQLSDAVTKYQRREARASG